MSIVKSVFKYFMDVALNKKTRQLTVVHRVQGTPGLGRNYRVTPIPGRNPSEPRPSFRAEYIPTSKYSPIQCRMEGKR